MNRLLLFSTLAILAHIPHQTYAAGQGVSVNDPMFERYLLLGCWKDTITNATTRARVLPSLEGKVAILDGHYKHRQDAVDKCFKAALQKKFEVFAVQDGGQCFSSADARSKYKQVGKSDKCEIMKGGPMANNVYEVGPLKKCLVFMPQRHSEKPFSTEQSKRIGTNETALHIAARFGETECAKILIDSTARIEAVDKNGKTPLAVAAEYNQCEVMKTLVKMNAKQDKLQSRQKSKLQKCITATPQTSPHKVELPYESLGCFKDSIPRALDSLEGNSKLTLILEDHYKIRTDAIKKCYNAAIKLGNKIFAVQDGGQCFSSNTAEVAYNKYGKSTHCGSDKKGGPMANNVYKIKAT